MPQCGTAVLSRIQPARLPRPSTSSVVPCGATTPVEGDDPPKRKEKGAEAKKASALAFCSTVGPPELLKDIG
jgi:hypothetical protein